MADGQDPSLVQDGFYDIAKRSSNEQMRISATGRRKFQFCYLVSSAMSKSSNVQYDATTDCLTDPAKLPTGKELEMTDLTKRYLEVGLIHGQEPAKYIATGAGRNKERELEKEKRGVLDRDQHAMRVFTPVTTKLKAQCKFYVGCAPVDGRLSPKLIRADRVYFYPEFWQAIGAKTTPSCKRLAALWKACREHAVEEEEKIPRVLIVADNESKTRTAHPSVTTASGQLASICILHYASFQETGNARHIADLRKTLKDPVGRAGFGPDTNTEGVLSLLDLSQPFSEEVALKAQNELAVSSRAPFTDTTCSMSDRRFLVDSRRHTRGCGLPRLPPSHSQVAGARFHFCSELTHPGIFPALLQRDGRIKGNRGRCQTHHPDNGHPQPGCETHLDEVERDVQWRERRNESPRLSPCLVLHRSGALDATGLLKEVNCCRS